MIILISLFKLASESNSPTSIFDWATVLGGTTVLFLGTGVLFSDWIRQMLLIN